MKSLPLPRKGEEVGLCSYPFYGYEETIGDPENAIWSSIHHLCSGEVADQYLFSIHGIKKKSARAKISKNIKLYLQQAYEFYLAAKEAKPNTGPLFYYYSFLHLAKARCEIAYPNFHKEDKCYCHGISWRPNRNFIVDPNTDTVTLIKHGVWQALLEAVTGQSCTVAQGTRLQIKDFFSYCPEISVEYERAFGETQRRLDLVKPSLVTDKKKSEAWIRFSVDKTDLKLLKLNKPKLIAWLKSRTDLYHEVLQDNKEIRTFELSKPHKTKRGQSALMAIRDHIRRLDLISHPSSNEIEYSIAILPTLPCRIPHMLALYTLIFWLGSLVRYDPHSVADLEESKFWIVIDGFMSQSRIWLLELFEWEFYQTETELHLVR
ncbi:MAG TPA: YaaC family protein [Burkholderiales bacterium]